MSRALEKGLHLLSCVADGHDTLGELARVSGLPKSTVHRLTTVLVDQRLLRYQDRRFRLDYRLLELSAAARRQIDYVAVARPHLEELSARTSETAHLGVLGNGHIVYLEKVEGDRGLQLRSYVGLRVPAQTTALGKMLIACRPPHEWRSHLLEVTPRTPRSITDRALMHDELVRVRAQGFALDLEENEPGTRCVAAPVWDASGHVIAAISISGASIYLSDARVRELVPVVRETAQAVSRDLGGGDVPHLPGVDSPRHVPERSEQERARRRETPE